VRFPEYDSLDALALAGLVARREVTALEALEAALERADRRDARLNAIVARFDDEARGVASGPLPAGPLSGVPFLLKDAVTAWKDHPLTESSRLGAGFRPDHDSEVVRRLKAAGLVLFGRTNASELGILAHTEPELHGACRNPWNTDHTPGGSSGGAAAAAASRIVPAAHGNDGGGSLRIPASHCGLFALKSTRGRVSLAPDAVELWGGMVVEGVMTRSVRDAAAFLDLLSGPAPGDPPGPPAPARPFLEEVGRPPGALRIAVTTGSFFGRGTHPEAVAATHEAAALLRDLGHVVDEARPSLDRQRMVTAYLRAVAADVAREVEVLARRTGRRPSAATLEPETASLAAAGRAFTAAELQDDVEAVRRLARDLAAFFSTWDVLLTPTVAAPPVRVGSLKPRPWERVAMRAAAATGSRALIDRLFDEVGERSFEVTGFTMPFNQTGQPACSVPLHWTAEGLPLGVQLVGRFGDEATLLRVAAQLESARPWQGRVPPVV
jgi:amidase